jgi:hypothetical protein
MVATCHPPYSALLLHFKLAMAGNQTNRDGQYGFGLEVGDTILVKAPGFLS